MNIEDLYTFHVVAQEQSISKAAETLNFVQSNITARIKRLEQEYETQLFYRHRHGVTLTSTGKSLMTYTEQILHLINESKKAIIHSKSPTGPLAIGAMETAAAVRLPPLLAAYGRRYPEVELLLHTDRTSELVKMVLNREIEGAFIAGEANHPYLCEVPVFEEKLVFIVQRNLASRLVKDDLEQHNLIVFKSGCFYRTTMEDWLRAEGIVPKRTMELNTLEGIIGCVKAGLGMSMLTESVVDQLDRNHDLARYPLPGTTGSVTTRFIYHKDIVKTAAFNMFVTMCQH